MLKAKLHKAKAILASLGLASYACDIGRLIKSAEEDEFVGPPDFSESDVLSDEFTGPKKTFKYIFESGDDIGRLKKFYGLPSDAPIRNENGEIIQSAEVGEVITIPLIDENVIRYVAVAGDTIQNVKERYGLRKGDKILGIDGSEAKSMPIGRVVFIPIVNGYQGLEDETVISLGREGYHAEIVAATLVGEAGRLTRDQMVNVFQVMKNRAGVGDGMLSDDNIEDLSRVCLADAQFSCWNGNRNNKMGYIKQQKNTKMDDWNMAIDIVRKNESSSNVGNSRNYIAKFLWDLFVEGDFERYKAYSSKGNRDMWVENFSQNYDDGDHLFGDL